MAGVTAVLALPGGTAWGRGVPRPCGQECEMLGAKVSPGSPPTPTPLLP